MRDKRKIGHGLATARYHHELLVSLASFFTAASTTTISNSPVTSRARSLEHYRRPDGTYDLDAAAHDWFRWPPIAARVKELKREKRRQGIGR
jgi:hypothetical protein